MSEGLRVPERIIPVPQTVSAEAQAFLSTMGAMPSTPEPDASDLAAWRARIEQANQQIGAMSAQAVAAFPAEITKHKLSATDLYEVTPANLAPKNKNRAVFYIHGGAYIMGGGEICAHMSLSLAGAANMRAFAIDYRMPPDHPFPAGLDDTIEAYRYVLKHYDPANIAVHGASAGGGLAASFILKARYLGLPLPAACVLLTPELDLTESGDTFETNAHIDVVLKGRLSQSIALYANGHDLTDPYLSAIYGDFSKGFPPTLLTSGTRDVFLSNTVRMHRALRRAGVFADLHVCEAMPHGGFFGGAPEDRELMEEQVRFINAHLG
jgi:monoterpene epsilon-lactone hydrolase